MSKFQQDVANPTALGMLSLALTTLLFSFDKANIINGNTSCLIYAMGLCYGGFGQLLAGVFDFIKGDTFGMSFFALNGLLWVSHVLLQLLPKMYSSTVTTVDKGPLAAYLFLWGLLAIGFLLGCPTNNFALRILLVFQTLFLFSVSASNLIEHNNEHHGANIMNHITGWIGIITGIIALYGGLAELHGWSLNIIDLYKRLPRWCTGLCKCLLARKKRYSANDLPSRLPGDSSDDGFYPPLSMNPSIRRTQSSTRNKAAGSINSQIQMMSDRIVELEQHFDGNSKSQRSEIKYPSQTFSAQSDKSNRSRHHHHNYSEIKAQKFKTREAWSRVFEKYILSLAESGQFNTFRSYFKYYKHIRDLECSHGWQAAQQYHTEVFDAVADSDHDLAVSCYYYPAMRNIDLKWEPLSERRSILKVSSHQSTNSQSMHSSPLKASPITQSLSSPVIHTIPAIPVQLIQHQEQQDNSLTQSDSLTVMIS